MLVVGLTGGIASGKSTVSQHFSSPPISLPLIDLDILARDAVAPNTRALKALHRHFGEAIICADGSLDRAALGDIVFHDESKRKVLNGIVHPAVRRLLVWELVRAWVRGESVVVVDAPLLVEAGLWKFCGAIVVVYCSEQLQLHRLQARNNLTPSQAQARISSQAPLSSKLQYADYVIDNSGRLADLESQITRVSTKLRERAGWSWVLSWIVPPWGLLRGLVTVLWRLYFKQVGREKKTRTRGERRGGKGAPEEIELRDRRRPAGTRSRTASFTDDSL